MSEVATLLVDGTTVEGFEGGQIVQSMERLASTWSLRYSTRVDESGDEVVIEAGDPVEIRLGGNTILEGYVDDDDYVYGVGGEALELAGRSRLGDLVDCSAFYTSRSWRDATLMTIASDLLDGYDVVVREESDTGDPFPRFKIEEGETIAQTLSRAAQRRGIVLLDRGGQLALVRAGQDASRTVLTSTMSLTARRHRSHRERFSDYIFEGQTRADDEVNGIQASEIANDIFDSGVRRLRRLRIRSWGERGEDLGEKAILERNTRAGRSLRLTYTVPGWRDDEGQLWAPNMRVAVDDDRLNVRATMLIVRTTHFFRKDQYRTQLELCRPEAFDVVVRYPTTARGARIEDP